MLTRPRLFERLDIRGGGKSITVITAPPGYGKTSLICHWLHKTKTKPAWLTFDDNDNDPLRFVAYLLAALNRRVPGFGTMTNDLLESSPTTGIMELMEMLVSEIERSGEDILLVLDNLHCLSRPPILDAMRLFCEQLPPTMRLILLSQTDPLFPLSKLRLAGRLNEIREKDLGFTPDETAELFNRLCIQDPDADLAERLTASTKGWIAGIRLAAISMEQSNDRNKWIQSFAGTDQYIADFLSEEALSRFPIEQKDCLAALAIPEILDDEVCSILGDRCAEAYRSMISMNLFLSPEGSGYRLHPMMRQMLLHRIESSPQVEPLVIHRKLSGYYEKKGELDGAVRHAVAAGDDEAAVDILERYAGALWDQRLTFNLNPWMNRLDRDRFPRHPQLSLYAARMSLNASDIGAAQIHIDDVERGLFSGGDNGDNRRIRGRIALQKATISLYRGELNEMSTLCRQAESLLSESDALWLSITASTLAVARLWTGIGDMDGSLESFRKSREWACAAGSRQLEIGSRFQEAIVLGWKGNATEAGTVIDQIIQEIQKGCVVQPGLESDIAAERAWLDWELGIEGDLRKSEVHAEEVTISCGPSIQKWWSLYRLTRLAVARNDLNTAKMRLRMLENVEKSIPVMPWLSDLAGALRNRIPGKESASTALPEVITHSSEFLLEQRAVEYAGNGQAHEAMGILDLLEPSVRASGRIRRLVVLLWNHDQSCSGGLIKQAGRGSTIPERGRWNRETYGIERGIQGVCSNTENLPEGNRVITGQLRVPSEPPG
jgi:LuxR family maltose regulon positive regulatory protein